MTAFYIDGLGVVGPGMPDWRAAREVLRGEREYQPGVLPRPDAAVLPANERRRAAASVRWALAAAQEAVTAGGYRADEAATVFATSGSDGETLHHICEALAGAGRDVSPTRFHNSVHNAAAGYWTIAAGTRRPSASVCGYDASFAVGLVEAASQVSAERSAVLLVAYDLPYPPPLHAARPVGQPFAVALLLAPEPRSTAAACCRIALVPAAAATPFPPALHDGLVTNPAAQSVPMLAMLAREEHESVRLEYLDRRSLVVERIK
jgi:hypothetical protein